jgi:hypothetical protein
LESAASLEKKYERVQKGKEDLVAKLETAKHLRENIFQLKSRKDFLSQKDLNQLDEDLKRQRLVFFESSLAEQEIKKLEEQIAQIKSSGKFLIPTAKVQITNQIEAMQNSLTNAKKVQQEISRAENNSGFCSEAQIEKLQKELNTVQNVLMKLQPSNPGTRLSLLQKASLKIISSGQAVFDNNSKL